MGFRVSDELLGTFVPIAVYWIYSGFYELLGGLHNYRLHPKGEEEVKNVATKATVVKGVLIQQAFQIAVSLLLFTSRIVSLEVGRAEGSDWVFAVGHDGNMNLVAEKSSRGSERGYLGTQSLLPADLLTLYATTKPLE
ncbi:uncharacterized protein A4U43_C03F500 [Asparagus officinalis]|uniref:Uncharacterized protein n=1 Tax=Asparagus officinalis TaxID=4686 RepID=A0A5P1F690_ASPOF|nr:uncharacterized protein A4U43_C03F500 [Asparagus officinalis]